MHYTLALLLLCEPKIRKKSCILGTKSATAIEVKSLKFRFRSLGTVLNPLNNIIHSNTVLNMTSTIPGPQRALSDYIVNSFSVKSG